MGWTWNDSAIAAGVGLVAVGLTLLDWRFAVVAVGAGLALVGLLRGRLVRPTGRTP